MTRTVIFDGHDLSDVVDVGVPNIGALASKTTYETVPGRNGKVVTGHTWDSFNVEFMVYAHGTPDECREALSRLGMWLDVDEPKRLVLPDWSDRQWLAMPDGDVPLARYVGDESGKVRFVMTDPIAYGARRGVTVPSGGSVSFFVGGTYKTVPRIVGTVKRDSSSHQWGIRLDEEDYLHVEIGVSSNVSLTLDCGECTCTVSGAVSLPTLSSDWLELSPGYHTLRNDLGSGSVSVSWEERWL